MRIPSACVFLQKWKLCRYLAILVVGNSCHWQFLSLPKFSEPRHKLLVCFYLSPVVLNFHLFSLLLTVNSKTTETQTSEKTDTFVKSIFKLVARSIATQFAETFIRMITSEIWVLDWPFPTNRSVNQVSGSQKFRCAELAATKSCWFCTDLKCVSVGRCSWTQYIQASMSRKKATRHHRLGLMK